MVALSVIPQKIDWDSLPAVVREKMDRSRVFDRGLTDIQALVLETRCRLGMKRIEFGQAVGLCVRGASWRGVGVTVYRWEAGLAVPSRESCQGMVKVARDGRLPADLVRRLEGLANVDRVRTGTPWGMGRSSRRTSGL